MTVAPPVLERLREQYEKAGLRPLVDPAMEMIVMDCPRCKAQEIDPEGIWRPARVVPRSKTRVILCTACDARDEQRLR